MNGCFDDATSNLAFLDPTPTYDSVDVTLRLTRNDLGFDDVGRTPNQRAVGSALTDGTGSDGVAPLVDAVFEMSGDQARSTHDNLSGVQHTHNPTMARVQRTRFRGLLSDRLGGGTVTAAGDDRNSVRLAFAGESWASSLAGSGVADETEGDDRGVWIRAVGGTGEVDATANASGSDYTSATLASGADTRLANGLTVGFAGSFGRTDADTAAGALDIDSYQLAGYGGWSQDSVYVDSTLGFGRNSTDAHRRVAVDDTLRSASADYRTEQFTWSLEGGRYWTWAENSTVTPFLGLDLSQSEREHFTESGAGAGNLDLDEEVTHSSRPRVGLRLTGTMDAVGFTLEPRADLAWVREHGDRDMALSAHFDAESATSSEVEGPKLDRDRAAVGLGVTAAVSDRSSVDLEYRGDIAGSDEHHGVAATWRLNW